MKKVLVFLLNLLAINRKIENLFQKVVCRPLNTSSITFFGGEDQGSRKLKITSVIYGCKHP